MNSPIFTFAVIPIIVLAVFISVRLLRRKVYKPEYEKNVQRPGKWERTILVIITIITIIAILGAVMGILAQVTEMALVFGGMALFFGLIILVLRNIADMAFEEKFSTEDRNDPYKKAETIHYIANYGYGYLVEDYLKEINDK